MNELKEIKQKLQQEATESKARADAFEAAGCERTAFLNRGVVWGVEYALLLLEKIEKNPNQN